MPELHTVIVGTKFRGSEAIAALRGLRQGYAIELQAEPDNVFDRDAVACFYDGRMLGYLPRTANTGIAYRLRQRLAVEAVVTDEGIVTDDGWIIAIPHITVRWE